MRERKRRGRKKKGVINQGEGKVWIFFKNHFKEMGRFEKKEKKEGGKKKGGGKRRGN
ncbi:hypothetical protein [Streptococcus pyogenes]|uniref:hypothetical protein n=1 Tax=Streptococcus pyogenes TaxID=1314 RepID=UPI001652D30F|nr:hypothetical protein [Streptococcus pyogenes]